MATVTNPGAGAGYSSTTNAATFSTPAAALTPAVGDLIVFGVIITGQTATDWTVTDDQGGTYTKAGRALMSTSVDAVEIWVRNSLVASAVAHVITISHASGNSTGSLGHPYLISGMTKTGAAAVKQFQVVSNQAAATPAVTFASAPLTTNPIIGLLCNQTNPIGVSGPGGTWNTGVQRAMNNPTTGFEMSFVSSGITASTITWGSASASVWAVIAVEFDASGGAAWTKTPTDALGLLDPVTDVSAYLRSPIETLGLADPTVLNRPGGGLQALNAFNGADDNPSGTATVFTTGSYAFQNNKLYLIAVSGRGGGGFAISSITGGGLTWVLVAELTPGGSTPYIGLYRALVTSGATTGALTITMTAVPTSLKWSCDEFTNVDTSGTNGSGAIVQSATNNGTSLTATVTLATFGDAVNNAAWMADGHSASEVSVPESGFTQLSDQQTVVAPVWSTATQWRVGQDTTPQMTHATSIAWRAVAVEIKAGTTGGAALSKSPTDAIGALDDAGSQYQQRTLSADALGMLDVLSRLAASAKTPTDPIGMLDSDIVARAKTSTDTIGLLDSVSRLAAFTRGPTDTIGLLDSRSLARAKGITDAIGLLDSRSRLAAFGRTPTDPVGITDLASPSKSGAAAKTIVDVIGLLDSATHVAAFVRGPTDAVGLLDSVSRLFAAARTPIDPVGITDSRGLARTRIFADVLGMTDSDVVARAKGVTDTIGLLDSRSLNRAKVLTDALGMLDSRGLSRAKGITDPLGMLDSIVRLFAAHRVVIDTLPVVDDATHAGAGAQTKVLADTLGITDTVARQAAFSRTSIDSLGLLDSRVVLHSWIRTYSDPIGILDPTSRVWAAHRSVADMVGMVDSATRIAAYVRSVIDQLGLTDGFVTSIVEITIVGPIEATLVRVTPIGAMRQATPYATILVVTARSGLEVVTPQAEMRRTV